MTHWVYDTWIRFISTMLRAIKGSHFSVPVEYRPDLDKIQSCATL